MTASRSRATWTRDSSRRSSDALLAYGNTEEGSKVLNSIYRISKFAPADLASLDIVREAAQKLGAK